MIKKCRFRKREKGSGLTLTLLPKNKEIDRLLNVDSEIYCKTHKLRLIHNRIIIYGGNNTPLEVGYCSKCHKEYCEFADISPIYISNYEWLYGDDY